MRLPPELIHAVQVQQPARFDLSPIQLGLQGDPFHVTIASMMLCRVRRVPSTIETVFRWWPTPDALAASDGALVSMLQPLGMHRVRARHMQLTARRWDTDTWDDLRDLPGVGRYVAAAVELFCFGCGHDAECDRVLDMYNQQYVGPRMSSYDGQWSVDDVAFQSPVEAYSAYHASLQAKIAEPHVQSDV